MLCSICQSIDFDKANCSPENGGARHQPSFTALVLSADNGCALCDLIRTKGQRESSDYSAKDNPILCNIWNWYNGPTEEYRGSATIIFQEENSSWSVVINIAADIGL